MKEKTKKTISEIELIKEVKRLSLVCLIKKLEIVLVNETLTENELLTIQTGLGTHSMLPSQEPDFEADDSPGEQLKQFQYLQT